MRLVVGNRLTKFALATGAMTAREAIEGSSHLRV